MTSSVSLRPLLLKSGLLLFLCLLLLFPGTCLSGAKNGLLLWFNQVLPSLLPFLILSTLFLSTGLSDLLAGKLSPLLSPIFRCSPSGCYAIVIGLFTGLPVGAKTIASLIEKGQITKKEGQYLLPMCNNMSPLFILGYISVSVLQVPNLRYLILATVVLASMLAAVLLRPKESPHASAPTVSETVTPSKRFSFSFLLLDSAIEQAFAVLTRVGGYMVLFSVLAALLTKLPLPPFALACIGSILEVTTGSSALAALAPPKPLLISLTAAFVSFGGLSTAAQTKSVLTGTGLPLAHYLFTKTLAALFTALLLLVVLRIV
ncbi:MAG: transporter [Lachnospiraceae bacterium]|nr:transporter [Lachnospiraceae bacterium]